MSGDPDGIDFPPNLFWDFSLEVYAAEGVSDACLALQDECGADVNMVLFCGWLGASGRGRLGAADLRAATEKVVGWQVDVVQPLRAARRRLRQGFVNVPPEHSDALRRRVAALEIEAEHVEQTVLASLVEAAAAATEPDADRAAAAAASLADYFALGGIRRIGGWRHHLVRIFTAIFPELDESALVGILEAAFAEAGGTPPPAD